ncbi:ABC transporter permease [Porticoccaceae bacterium]|jgi:general nucleoside transport system permease protein|nr:ABC transporter permease [Porticoccaceae bacterium]MDA9014678.1 ABC transporter permease [Porticoccaceae bacterium]
MRIKLEARGQQSKLMAYLSPILAAVLTLIWGALLFWLLGKPPLEALHTFLIMPISDPYRIAELLVKAGPIVLCAIGLSICFRANVWNIGAEGQLLMGGLVGSCAALWLLDVEGIWVLPVVLIAGILGGAAWAAIPAVLKNYFNTNEILSTIMLNYISLNILLYGVHGPLKDPDGFNFPESALFSDWQTMPILLEGTRLHLGVSFALFAMAGVWVLMNKTFIGFQIKVLGGDERSAHFAGFKQKRLVWFCLLLCGGLAGLAGVGEVTGPIGQLVPNISPGYGYAAIIVAFLGRLHPLGILFAGLLMAMLYMGGEMVQIHLNLPRAITGVFQGMLLLFLLICDVFITYRLVIEKSASKAIEQAIRIKPQAIAIEDK